MCEQNTHYHNNSTLAKTAKANCDCSCTHDTKRLAIKCIIIQNQSSYYNSYFNINISSNFSYLLNSLFYPP